MPYEVPQDPLAARSSKDRFYSGTLLEYGRAPHEFHRHGHPSYYVKLLNQGRTLTLWGRGLEAAFRASRTRPDINDLVGIRQNHIEPAAFVDRKRNSDGIVMATRTVDSPRPRYLIEKLMEFDRLRAGARALLDPSRSRREAVQGQRDLEGYFHILAAGQDTAARRIPEPERQEMFMKLLRATVALAYLRGEPPPVKQEAAQSRAAPQAPAPRFERTRE